MAEGRAWTDEEEEWYKLIEESGLFDANYYLETYEDAKEDGRYHLVHYIEIGAYLGYNPNNWFDAEWYVEYYEDVRESGMNPLAHYVLYGKKLGYETQAWEDGFVAQVEELDIPLKKVIAIVGQPRSGLTLLTALLGVQEEITSWFLPYSTRKDYRITSFESEMDFKQKFREIFPDQTMNETIVLSESSGELEALKFLRESLLSFEREGIEVQVIWNMRNLKESYLSQNETAYEYWGGDQQNPSLDSLEKYLDFSRDSFRNIFEYFYRFKPIIVAYEYLINDPLLLLNNIWKEDRPVSIPEMEQMLKLNFAGDPGFGNFSTIVNRSEKRLNEWEKNCLEIEENLPESYSTFLNWHTWIKEELGSGKVFNDFTSGRGKNKFDADYYLSNCDEFDADAMDPWEHYLQTGWMHGCQPNAWFDVDWYRENFYENDEIPDFIHFETVGWLYVRIGGGESLSSGRMQNLKIIDPESYVISDDLVLEAPKFKNPKVSIVVPAYNEEKYTMACIESIIENTEEDVSYEIILMDDKSPDESARLIERNLKNIKFISNGVNYGFLQNCNKGATFAIGEYILFLNNDTNVQPGWLSPLVELIESADDIGMVGSRLVYPTGQQQEAGGIVWDDASGWNFGRLDDPNKPEYNYVKETDYLTGAAMMIRTSLWEEIGGFDERYVPAYFEDSDLAFEVRAHGYRAMYQPRSVVIHFEGISHGTDVGTGIKQYQVHNREKFIEKWKKVLAEEQFPNAQEVFLARDRSRFKKQLLMIDHYLPHFDQDAGSRTVFAYLKMFVDEGFKVTFIGDNFYDYPDTPYLDALQQMGVEVLYGEWYAKHWQSWLEQNGHYFDYAFLNRPHISEKYIDHIKKHTDAKIIYYGHDLHFLREHREYILTDNKEKLDSSVFWQKKEFDLMKKADVSIFPSENEVVEILKIDPNIQVQSMPAYLFTRFDNEKKNILETQDIMFVGGFTHTPNIDAVLWFIDKVWPKIKKTLPELKFYIIGSNPSEEILKLASKDVIVTGFISDDELEMYYRQCKISVVPLRYGAGVKGKVVESLYQQVPIVTTTIGAEGLEEAEKYMIIKDRPKDFADAVIDLYDNKKKIKKFSKKGQEYCKKYFSYDAAKAALNGIFEFKKGVSNDH